LLIVVLPLFGGQNAGSAEEGGEGEFVTVVGHHGFLCTDPAGSALPISGEDAAGAACRAAWPWKSIPSAGECWAIRPRNSGTVSWLA
jgi:hypothetical protein